MATVGQMPEQQPHMLVKTSSSATSPSGTGPTLASPTVVASPSNSSTGGPNASPQSAQSPGWIPAFGHNSEPVKDLPVGVSIAEEIPQAVSEEGQERTRLETEAAAQTGWWKQNLAKVRGNLCGPLHIGDMLFSAWVFMWIIITGTAKDDVKYLWLVVFLLSYLSYVNWNWKSDERLYVWNMMDVGSFETYWKRLRTISPVITMQTESWHWERRVSSSTTYHAGGGSTTTTTVTYVRVVSHEETEIFAYNLCVDLSLDVEGSDLAQNNATFVHLWKEYIFGTMPTALAYHSQLAALKSRNQSRDTYMDTFECMTMPEWMRIVGVYRDSASRPLLLHGWIFVLAFVILLSWPMKIYMEWAAKKGGFTMRKQISL